MYFTAFFPFFFKLNINRLNIQASVLMDTNQDLDTSDLNHFMTSLSIKEKVGIFAICDAENFCPGIAV